MVCGRVQLHSFTCDFSFISTICWEIILTECFWHSCQKSFHIDVKVSFWTLNSDIFIYMSVFLSVPHSFDYYSSVVSFEIRKCESLPTFFCFFKIVLTIRGPLQFYMNFRISLSISTKNSARLLIEIVLYL